MTKPYVDFALVKLQARLLQQLHRDDADSTPVCTVSLSCLGCGIAPVHHSQGPPEPFKRAIRTTFVRLSLMPRPECPAENSAALEQTTFFNKDGINWTPHTIGWSIAGGCALLVCLSWPINNLACPHFLPQTLFISIVSVLKHCRYVFLVIAVVVTLTLHTETTRILLNSAKCMTTSCTVRICLIHSLNLDRLRILYMPPIYGIVSFLSYRFFREYTYFELVQVGEYSVAYFFIPLPALTYCSLRGS